MESGHSGARATSSAATRLGILHPRVERRGTDLKLACRFPDSGLIVPTHTTKAGAVEPGNDRAMLGEQQEMTFTFHYQ